MFVYFFWPMNHAQNMNVGVRKRVCNHNCTEEQKEFRGDRHFLQTEVSNITSFLRNPKSFHTGELTFSGCGKVSCFCLSSPATWFWLAVVVLHLVITYFFFWFMLVATSVKVQYCHILCWSVNQVVTGARLFMILLYV